MEIQDIENYFEECCSKGKQRNMIVAGGEWGPERDLFKDRTIAVCAHTNRNDAAESS